MNKITIIAAALICSAAAAQDFTRHEFSVHLGGGVSSFQTRPTIGKNNWKLTGTTGLGYHYFFDQQWGIGTGVDFDFFNGGITIKNYSEKQAATNRETGHAFDFLVSSSRYRETLRAMTVTIPLMVQYQYLYAEKIPLYAAFGFKLGFPASAKSKSKGNFTTKGYYPNIEVTYEDLPDYGFVTNQPFPANKTDVGLKTAFMTAVELGVKYPLSEKISCYVGLYVDYGLNNMLKKKSGGNATLVVYQSDTPEKLAYVAAANAHARRIAPLAVGINLRFAFGASSKPKDVVETIIVEIPPPDDSEAQRLAEEEAARQRALAAEQEAQRLAAEADAQRQAEADRLIADQEAQRLAAEADAQRRAEADRLAREQEAQRLAAEKARQEAEARQQAIEFLQQPISNFSLDKTPPADQKSELDKRVEILKQYPDIKIFINGHTCDTGTAEANERVGLLRAQKAKEYLISQGVSESQITGVTSKRDAEPLVPNTSEDNRIINRRVQMVLVD